MKHFKYLNLLTIAVFLTASAVSCKTKPKNPTPIPGNRANLRTGEGFGPGTGAAIPPEQPPIDRTAEGTIPLTGWDPSMMDQDRETLRAQTVYFDLDRATVKASERANVEAVAAFLRNNAANGVLIEGHCDERGTEQYNLSLGDRRAQALREYLVNLGIDSQRVHPISFGEAQPAVPGHDESAWSRNRRGEFILLKPKR